MGEPRLTNPLPCPFCGDRSPLVHGRGSGCWVECSVATCKAAGGLDYREEAVERWNRRAEPKRAARAEVTGA